MTVASAWMAAAPGGGRWKLQLLVTGQNGSVEAEGCWWHCCVPSAKDYDHDLVEARKLQVKEKSVFDLMKLP